ncbi:hypothetical protein X975_09362, partial [Stegodyphus mimosarum]
MSKSENLSEELQLSFEEEVLWCIRKLESILTEQKLNAKAAKSATQGLKVLRNNKTPFVKKRQVMHMTCGDYRKSMREEMKSLKEAKNSISAVKDAKTGVFIRKTNKKNREEKVQEFFFRFQDPDDGNKN